MKTRGGKKRRAHDRELALAYLGALSADEMRLDQVIDDHIRRVLQATNQNLSLAADLLGMHRRSLQRYARRKQLRTGRGQRGKRQAAKRQAAKRQATKRQGTQRHAGKRQAAKPQAKPAAAKGGRAKRGG